MLAHRGIEEVEFQTGLGYTPASDSAHLTLQQMRTGQALIICALPPTAIIVGVPEALPP
jgi:hypothetical protein